MYEQLQLIRMYLSGMWKYRWFGIAASWMVCTGIWTYVYLKPDIYEATGKIQIDMNTALKPILKGLAVDSNQSGTINLMSRQLMSRPVLERIIRGTDLGLYATNELQMEYMINHLRNTIHIDIPKSGGRRSDSNSLVTISYIDPKPKLAYAIVKKVIDILVENTLGANQTDTDVAHSFLRSQIKDYENRLSAAEQKLAEFKKKNVGVMPDQGGGYYNRLQTATDGLRKIENDLQLAKNKVKILKIQIQQEVARSVTASYDKKIQEHEDKLNTLLLQFTDKHPDVQAEKSIIASLKKNKEEAIKNAASDKSINQNDDSLQIDQVYQNLQIALKEAEVNVSNIEASKREQQRLIKTLQKQVDTAPEIEAQLSRLNRDYEITKTKYSALVSRLDSARISSQAEKSSEDINFKVIEPPIIPIIPVGPKRFLLNSSAILAGLAAFFGITFLILQLKPVFLTKKELTNLTGLPVLGAVTMVLDAETKKRKLKERFIMVSLGVAQVVVLAVIVLSQH
jgi:polysaccharide chain length determinant protein (PEP-CTERM system associated)